MTKRVIYKYLLSIVDYQTLKLGCGDKVLSVQNQNGALVMWVVHYPDDLEVERAFTVHGTGNPIDPEYGIGGYIGTAQIGPLVWHVFEVGVRT